MCQYTHFQTPLIQDQWGKEKVIWFWVKNVGANCVAKKLFLRLLSSINIQECKKSYFPQSCLRLVHGIWVIGLRNLSNPPFLVWPRMWLDAMKKCGFHACLPTFFLPFFSGRRQLSPMTRGVDSYPFVVSSFHYNIRFIPGCFKHMICIWSRGFFNHIVNIIDLSRMISVSNFSLAFSILVFWLLNIHSTILPKFPMLIQMYLSEAYTFWFQCFEERIFGTKNI